MPVGLENPPALPPDVTGQMGNPMAGMAGQFEKAQGGLQGDTGAAHPQGAVLAALETIDKLLSQVAEMSPDMRPFVARATSILQAGKSQISSKPAGPQGMEKTPEAMQTPAGAAPGRPFPG